MCRWVSLVTCYVSFLSFFFFFLEKGGGGVVIMCCVVYSGLEGQINKESRSLFAVVPS